MIDAALPDLNSDLRPDAPFYVVESDGSLTPVSPERRVDR
jgi:hypothetical protein